MGDYTFDKLAFEGAQFHSSGDFGTAIERFKSAIQEGTSNKRLLSSVYLHLGACYYSLGKHEESLVHFYEDLTLNRCRGGEGRAIKDEVGEARALGNIANVLRTCGRVEETVELATSQLRMADCVNSRVDSPLTQELKGRALWTLGVTHLAMLRRATQGRSFNDLFSRTVRYFKSYSSVCPGDPRVLAGNYSFAKKYYRMVVGGSLQRLEEATGDVLAMTQINLGSCCLLSEDYTQAIHWFGESLGCPSWSLRRRSLGCLGHSLWLAGEYAHSIKYHQTLYTEACSNRDHAVMVGSSLTVSQCCCHCGRIRDAIHFAEEHQKWALQGEDKSAAEAAKGWLEELAGMSVVNDSLGDLIERVDGGRLFDQRVSPLRSGNEEASILNDLFDRMQLMRIDDQRAELSSENSSHRKGSHRGFFKRLMFKN